MYKVFSFMKASINGIIKLILKKQIEVKIASYIKGKKNIKYIGFLD